MTTATAKIPAQIIKIAPASDELRGHGHQEITPMTETSYPSEQDEVLTCACGCGQPRTFGTYASRVCASTGNYKRDLPRTKRCEWCRDDFCRDDRNSPVTDARWMEIRFCGSKCAAANQSNRLKGLSPEERPAFKVSGRLRELRNASTETNRSIADAADVAERSVANWMSGETGMKYEHAKVVANLFGVDVTWLWTGEHSTGPNGPTPDPFANRSDRGAVETGRSRARRMMPVLGDCERCGAPAVDRHHKDENTLNNSLDNLEQLCRRCHKRHHVSNKGETV